MGQGTWDTKEWEGEAPAEPKRQRMEGSGWLCLWKAAFLQRQTCLVLQRIGFPTPERVKDHAT